MGILRKLNSKFYKRENKMKDEITLIQNNNSNLYAMHYFDDPGEIITVTEESLFSDYLRPIIAFEITSHICSE